MVLPTRGWTSQSMGPKQGEQPTLSKQSIRPELRIPASPSAFSAPALAEDNAQPQAQPRIKQRKRRVVALLIIFKPAPQGSVHSVVDGLPATPLRASGWGAAKVFEFLQTLLSAFLRSLRSRPLRTLLRTDWSFTSHCFPHRLAMVPRLAAGCSYVRLQAGERMPEGGTCTPPAKHSFSRTSADVQVSTMGIQENADPALRDRRYKAAARQLTGPGSESACSAKC
jgi:hypothetical protein